MSTAEAKKLRVGILFGGRSGEHEVSLLSAASVLKAIDREKYEVIPVGITKEGRWITAAAAQALLSGETSGALADGSAATAFTSDLSLADGAIQPTSLGR